jgi:hypothetical protein
MGELTDLVHSMVAGPITEIAGQFRASIEIAPRTGRDRYGPTYGDFVSAEALVEMTSETVMGSDGTERVSGSKLTFFGPTTIVEGDRVRLNGVVSDVIKIGGLLDPTGVPYVPEAWLGKM